MPGSIIKAIAEKFARENGGAAPTKTYIMSEAKAFLDKHGVQGSLEEGEMKEMCDACLMDVLGEDA